jgi:hypothetical protein
MKSLWLLPKHNSRGELLEQLCSRLAISSRKVGEVVLVRTRQGAFPFTDESSLKPKRGDILVLCEEGKIGIELRTVLKQNNPQTFKEFKLTLNTMSIVKDAMERQVQTRLIRHIQSEHVHACKDAVAAISNSQKRHAFQVKEATLEAKMHYLNNELDRIEKLKQLDAERMRLEWQLLEEKRKLEVEREYCEYLESTPKTLKRMLSRRQAKSFHEYQNRHYNFTE